MRLGHHVLYFALQPSPEAASAALARLQEAAQRFGLGRRATTPARLHVSTCGVGAYRDWPEDVIGVARAAAARVRAPAFRIAFNRIGSWGRGEGPRPVVLWGDEGVIGAERLHDALHAALSAAGLRTGPPPPICPHMTLARDRAFAPEAFVAPVAWTVREVVLISSLHGAGRQDVVGRFALG